MTELDRALVRRKLAAIVRNLGDLAAIEGLTLEEYRRDRFRQKGAERLQEAIEAAVDVNLHLLRAKGAATPPDYYESFLELRTDPDDGMRAEVEAVRAALNALLSAKG